MYVFHGFCFVYVLISVGLVECSIFLSRHGVDMLPLGSTFLLRNAVVWSRKEGFEDLEERQPAVLVMLVRRLFLGAAIRTLPLSTQPTFPTRFSCIRVWLVDDGFTCFLFLK